MADLTLPCSECEEDVDVPEGQERVVCFHCHATLNVVFDADCVDGTWQDCSYTYLPTPEDA